MSQKSDEGFPIDDLRMKLTKIEVALNAIAEAIVWTDQFGHIDWCNPAFANLVQRSSAQLLASPLIDVLPLQAFSSLNTTSLHPIQRALTDTPQGTDQYWLSQSHQPPRLLDITWAYVDAASTTTGLTTIILTIRDLTERYQAEQAQRQVEARYALAAQSTPDGIWDWQIRTGNLYVSDHWRLLLGLTSTDRITTVEDWFSRVHPDDIDAMRAALSAHLQGSTAHFQWEYRLRHAAGHYRWMLSRGTLVPDPDQGDRLVGTQMDITDRKTLEAQLRYDALHDPLTSLPNRTLFQQRVTQAIQAAGQQAHPTLLAVLLLDLDHFRVINDSLGPSVGDQLLVTVAQRLQAVLPSEQTLARMSGDEFAILLEHLPDQAAAIAWIEILQQAIAQPCQLEGHEVLTTASAGLMITTLDGHAPLALADDLIRNADIATHRAKKNGKAQFEVFVGDMHTDAMTRLQLENDLRQAINRQEFVVYYQPIVSLGQERLIGFEALIRWQHPRHGFISPASFIPIAEDTGMIVPIGYWVLREACRQLRDWQQRHHLNQAGRPLTVSVNLSGRQFTQPDLVEQIEAILAETQLDARSLKLEITESVIMNNAESAASMLGQLQKRGIQVSIDDFGTGYSSLSYLYQLPIDTLKIDRSFINSIDKDGEKLELVRTIVSLAWNLGMDVIAEGVETTMQLAQLKALRCESGQGYLFAKPLSPIEVEALLVQSATQHDPDNDDSTFIHI